VPDAFPSLVVLRGPRVQLEPQTVAHARDMVDVLSSPRLYAFTGGEPPSLPQLRARYARQLLGPADDMDQAWRNWVVCAHEQAVGHVQATLQRQGGAVSAAVAWVVGQKHQGHGLANEAAGVMVEHLRAQGVRTVTARIADANLASVAVAGRLGLCRTGREEDGERLWLAERT